jgi:hypothetical protein
MSDTNGDQAAPAQKKFGQAPNVVVVLIDDMGFGASSAFGGPCEMPTAERLARGGLRYNQFHTTGDILQRNIAASWDFGVATVMGYVNNDRAGRRAAEERRLCGNRESSCARPTPTTSLEVIGRCATLACARSLSLYLYADELICPLGREGVPARLSKRQGGPCPR